MKGLFNIVTLLIVTANFAEGQLVDKTLQKLIINKFITEKQSGDFKKLINRIEVKTKASYLYALFELEFKKFTGQNYSPIGTYLNFENEKRNPGEQAKTNEVLSGYLFRLKECGLLTNKQFTEQSEKINTSRYVHILQLLTDVSSQSAYEEWLSPDNVIQYGKKLLASNVVTEESFTTLKNDVNADKIKSHYQLIGYCKMARFFDLAKYSNDPSVYLEQIHREVSTLLPGLSFTNFNYKIDVDSAESFKDFISHKVTVSFSANGKTYKQKSFISPNDIGKNGNYLGKLDGQKFYQIFNKVLADNQSPFRLHQVQAGFQYGQTTTYQFLGIIALSKNQLDMFRNSDGYIQISYENFKNTLTSGRIDSAIKAYQQIGLLNHLTALQIEEAKEKIKEQENRNLNDVLTCFPNIIHLFDTELSNLNDPYAELLRDYRRISHTEFNPVDISDNFDLKKNKQVLVSFKLGNKAYSKTFKIDGDWVDTDFFEFIKATVEENKLKGQFYILYTGGQDVSIIYLTRQQHNYLKTNKLLVFSDDWQAEIE